MASEWNRVSKRRPCPVCGKPDWCLYTGDDDRPAAAICARVESEKQCGEGGWLHLLRSDGPPWPKWQRTIHVAEKSLQPPSTLVAIRSEFFEVLESTTPAKLAELAGALGVSLDSLQRLETAWLPKRKVWGFPMKDSGGRIVGVRLRLSSGKKLSIKGGREGLFLPIDLAAGGRLLVCEGPTDTAALLGLGFSAVGRPSCTGGVTHIVGLAGRLQPAEIVIVADADGPGQRGAGGLASALLAYAPTVRVITPPAKDARAWVQTGATAADVNALISATPAKTLKIRVSPSNKTPSLHASP